MVLARTIDPQTGCSVLFGRKVTAVPKSLDRMGYLLSPWLLRRSYLMYPRCVAEEVCTCLAYPEDFSNGSSIWAPYVVCDGNLITSRWYLDAELFAERFADAFEQRLHSENRIA